MLYVYPVATYVKSGHGPFLIKFQKFTYLRNNKLKDTIKLKQWQDKNNSSANLFDNLHSSVLIRCSLLG